MLNLWYAKKLYPNGGKTIRIGQSRKNQATGKLLLVSIKKNIHSNKIVFMLFLGLAGLSTLSVIFNGTASFFAPEANLFGELLYALAMLLGYVSYGVFSYFHYSVIANDFFLMHRQRQVH